MYLHVLFYPILFHFKACTILLTDFSPNKFNSNKEIKMKQKGNRKKNVSAWGLAKLGDKLDRKNEENREMWIVSMTKKLEDIIEYTK